MCYMITSLYSCFYDCFVSPFHFVARVCLTTDIWVQHLKFELSRPSLRSLQLLYEASSHFADSRQHFIFNERILAERKG